MVTLMAAAYGSRVKCLGNQAEVEPPKVLCSVLAADLISSRAAEGAETWGPAG